MVPVMAAGLLVGCSIDVSTAKPLENAVVVVREASGAGGGFYPGFEQYHGKSLWFALKVRGVPAAATVSPTGGEIVLADGSEHPLDGFCAVVDAPDPYPGPPGFSLAGNVFPADHSTDVWPGCADTAVAEADRGLALLVGSSSVRDSAHANGEISVESIRVRLRAEDGGDAEVREFSVDHQLVVAFHPAET